MKKLTLKLEELSIESFDTAAAEKETGTVLAHGTKDTCDPVVGTCFGYTCYETCETLCGSCDFTCDPAVGTCFGYTCYEGCRG